MQSGGRWQTLGVAAGLGADPQVQRDPGLASEGVLRLCTILSLPPSSSGQKPLDYFVWSYVENITNITSHNTKASLIVAIRRVFAELPPALVEKACSSSGSVSRRWLRLKAATLNRYQLYYIIKLPELIFSIKVLKWNCIVVFFRTTVLSFHPIYIYIYIHVCVCVCAFTKLSTQAEHDTGSIFKRSYTGLNSEFSSSPTCCHNKVKELVCPLIYP